MLTHVRYGGVQSTDMQMKPFVRRNQVEEEWGEASHRKRGSIKTTGNMAFANPTPNSLAPIASRSLFRGSFRVLSTMIGLGAWPPLRLPNSFGPGASEAITNSSSGNTRLCVTPLSGVLLTILQTHIRGIGTRENLSL